MSFLIPVWLVLTIAPAPGSPQAAEPQRSFQVFADLEHKGTLGGPLTSSWRAGKDFAIVAPLPTRSADGSLLTDKTDASDLLSGRLGRLRVKTTKGAGEIEIAIESDNRRCLQLYRKLSDGWRRVSPGPDKSWTLAPESDGTLDVGVGVILTELNAASAQAPWPREFTVAISAKGGAPVRVPFRVAPYVIPSTLDPVDELLIVSQPITSDAVRAVVAFGAKTGFKLNAFEADDSYDQWMQDTIEPGVFAFPTALGTEQARAALTGLRKEARRSSAKLDFQVARRLRRSDVVTIIPGLPRKRSRWVDWYGNIEATPPFKDPKGRWHRYGRVITGKQRELTMHPGVMKIIEAQGLQWPPIVVDTSWLAIGHVDEVVNFVPAGGRAGFKVLLPSPKKARDVLENLLSKGLGSSAIFAGTMDETTVEKLRTTVAGSPENLGIDEKVETLRTQLKTELNLLDSDFAMLPALFRRGLALVPDAVNSVVLDGHLLVSAQRGPVQDGADLFEVAIREALASCDVQVVFIDSWRAYHVAGGEVHCGTNAFRRLRDPSWWTDLVDPGEKSGLPPPESKAVARELAR